MSESAPVSVPVIEPSAIGTPFPQNARNRTGQRGRLSLPVYNPELAADAVLHAAEHPIRSITGAATGASRFWPRQSLRLDSIRSVRGWALP